MRWGDGGAGGGDEVDDDLDDARRDGDDDGGDFPHREEIFLEDFSLSEAFFFVSGFRPAEAAEKLFKVCDRGVDGVGLCPKRRRGCSK